MAKKYLRCSICGQLVEVVNDTKVPIICCGEPMEEIVAHTNEQNLNEKHIPQFKIKDKHVDVKIGSIPHPSTTDHFIEWITLETSKGSHTKQLKPGDAPEVVFVLADGELVQAIYAYCNIHSLWKNCVSKTKKFDAEKFNANK